MKLSIAKFYPAHPSNYSVGRPYPIDRITIHHSAGWENTLRHLWGDPSRNGSSHFWVGAKPGQIEQYVDTKDTAWTNGNLYSNQRAITIEVRGDWRGYFNQPTLDNLYKLLLALRKKYPNTRITYHNSEIDLSRYPGGTVCPADLKKKGYAKGVWDKVTKALKQPTPKPAPKPTPKPKPAPKITYKKITPKRIELIRPAKLWNFNFTNWSKAKSVASYPKGYVVDVVAQATNSLGAKYYLTAYSYNNGKIRATNGFNIADTKDHKPTPAPAPKPKPAPTPKPEPEWLPMDTPRKLRTAVDAYVINLDTKAKQGDKIKQGTDIDFIQKKTDKDNKVYLRSKWAKTNNKNWGIPLDQLEELPKAKPVVETIPEKPLDVDPDTPGWGDIEKRLNLIEELVNAIIEVLTKLKFWQK